MTPIPPPSPAGWWIGPTPVRRLRLTRGPCRGNVGPMSLRMILKTRSDMIRSGGRLVLLGVLATGCGAADRAPDSGSGMAATADTAGRPAGLIEGTPPGGLVDWVADIEAGMPPTMAELSANWGAMQRALLDLYVGRQEYLEMYWGPAGRLQGEGGAALGTAVLDLETAFHELLQAFSAQPMDTVRVAAAVGVIRERTRDVLRVAPESGLALVPPGNPPAAARK